MAALPVALAVLVVVVWAIPLAAAVLLEPRSRHLSVAVEELEQSAVGLLVVVVALAVLAALQLQTVLEAWAGSACYPRCRWLRHFLVVVAAASQIPRLAQAAVAAAGMPNRQEPPIQGVAAVAQGQTGSQYLAAAVLLCCGSLPASQ